MAEDGMDYKEEKKGRGQTFIAFLLFLNTAVILGVAYFQFTMYRNWKQQGPSIQDIVSSQQEENGRSLASTAKEPDGRLFPLERFTANLAQGDGPRRFVRLKLVLQFSKDSKEEEFKTRKPKIRDTIINILNSKRPEDLLKVEGKTYLKEEIKSAINAFLLDGHVKDVFYIGFQIN